MKPASIISGVLQCMISVDVGNGLLVENWRRHLERLLPASCYVVLFFVFLLHFVGGQR